jgi:hypothetical protein
MKLNITQAWFSVSVAEYNRMLESELPVNQSSQKQFIGTVTKEIDIGSLPVPNIGEGICDPIWDSHYTEQKVVNVAFDYQGEICYITLEPYVVDEDSEARKNIKRIAEGHGWKYSEFC